MRCRLAGLGALLFAGLACHSTKPSSSLLELSVSPPQLKAGAVVLVTARPVPPVELLWVSGTVKVMGAPVVGFKQDKATKLWQLRSQVPAFVSIPPGLYAVKAWGKTRAGEDIKGEMEYEAK